MTPRVVQLALVMATVLAIPQTISAQEKISWPMASQITVAMGNNVVRFVVYTEAEFVEGFSDVADSVSMPKLLEFQRVAKCYADSLGQEVTVIILKVRNFTESDGPYRVFTTDAFSIERNGQEIYSYGLAQNVSADPGSFQFGYVVFPRIEFYVNDVFVIRLQRLSPVK